MAAQTTAWRTLPTCQVSCPPIPACLHPPVPSTSQWGFNSSNQGISLLWLGRLEALVSEKLMDSKSPGHGREASGVRFSPAT